MTTIRFVRNIYLILVLASLVAQIPLNWGNDNGSSSALIAAFASILAALYALSDSRPRVAPIPCLIILFFDVSNLGGPLIFKTLQLDSLSSNLQAPVITVSVLALTQIVMVASSEFWISSKVLQSTRTILMGILSKTNIFVTPSYEGIWILGSIGLLSVLIRGGSESSSDYGDQLLNGLSFLVYAPVLLLAKELYGEIESRKHYLAVGLYSLLILLLAVAKNSRGIFVDAICLYACIFLLSQFRGYNIQVKSLISLNIIFALFIATTGYVVFSRLAVAMTVVRESRAAVGSIELASLTVEAFFNQTWINSYKDAARVNADASGYDDYYLQSTMLSRLVMIKYHDIGIDSLSRLGAGDLVIINETQKEKLIGLLPQPVLNILNINIDKRLLNFSFGDQIEYFTHGQGLGYFLTGSMIAELLFRFGWWFPLVVAGISAILYTVLSSLTFWSRNTLYYSPLLLLLIWKAVGTLASFGLNAESTVSFLSYLIRGLPQSIVIYSVLLFLPAVRKMNVEKIS